MTLCAGKKRDGSPCRLPARGGSSWCWAHDPENAAQRRENATKGGRARGPGPELREVQGQLRDLAADVLSGKVDKGKASVAAQVFGVYVRSVETARRLRETEELAERIAALEADRDGWGGGAARDW